MRGDPDELRPHRGGPRARRLPPVDGALLLFVTCLLLLFYLLAADLFIHYRFKPRKRPVPATTAAAGEAA